MLFLCAGYGLYLNIAELKVLVYKTCTTLMVPGVLLKIWGMDHDAVWRL